MNQLILTYLFNRTNLYPGLFTPPLTCSPPELTVHSGPKNL